MDSLHVGPVLAEGLYDLSSHSYHAGNYPSTVWTSRSDSYQLLHNASVHSRSVDPLPFQTGRFQTTPCDSETGRFQTAPCDSETGRFQTAHCDSETGRFQTTPSDTIIGRFQAAPCETDIERDWGDEDEECKDEDKTGSDRNVDQSLKQSQVAATLTWLTDNYERSEGVCLPRCVLYTHYLDFCKKTKFSPAGAATFGKIIRQKFPKLTTRRLGTRGQSKYHYYGIGIKESSIYYHSVYSGKGLTRFSGIKIKTEGSNRKYSLSSKTGTLLPEFPDANNLILPDEIDRNKVETFIMMYRTHCQRILDTMISANFDEVQNFLLHFWQGMPEHLVDVLNIDLLSDVIALCDSILYKVLIDVLIPSSIQDLPDSLGSDIRVFVKRLPVWLKSSLENVPKNLHDRKLKVAQGFIQSILRQTSFVHLAQTARSVLQSNENVSQMIEDLADVDFEEICNQAGYVEPEHAQIKKEVIFEYFDELQQLLGKQAPVEAYTEWVDNIIDKCVLQPTRKQNDSDEEQGARFLLQWALFGSLLMRDLTLNSASSFGSFHLVHMMLDEYVFLVFETQQDQEREDRLQKDVQRHMKNAEEIRMHAKLRTPSKAHNSPKGRKRKLTGDQYDSVEESEDNSLPNENRPSTLGYQPVSGTAFSRPPPSNPARDLSLNYPAESGRSGCPVSSLPLPPIKHYSTSFNNGSYDRPSYLSQLGVNPYSDYVTNNSSLTVSRMQPFSDSHVLPQTFSSGPFSANVSPVGGTYWTDSRTLTSFTADPYSQYGYNSLSTSYDNYKKNTLIRGGVYPDSYSRPAFDTSRGYYPRTHDNLQVGNTIPVGSYGGNFMEIASNSAQYPRQDGIIYDENIYQNNMTPSLALGKSYLTTTPFR
ncbi:DNA-binding protein RFX6-like [Gigantopelta aegis]|uniref:DNA-binding protein RFX6-like n=1 Tax=Gigantopelta aegis TaxID=1735272 RepID=UPI001B8883F1|nr:DNA-binding protein RFX6-like [Gigantopelta aegis]